ncbi:hypothetical protein SEA_JUMBO_52 [Gordonia phage Jumbo]|uniref:Uncharacterized protein n=1 Tax=Gordonia phage Jumbo TaxID=1887650 RepID=A0A1B3B0P0_9CAUD|nr:hypothetical protein BIZ69_gp052 [Gordonia phage Jumbo]AOE44562.1 hypothetical protein SEA_JUMBO_52 [Gordonia phage Jumbo]
MSSTLKFSLRESKVEKHDGKRQEIMGRNGAEIAKYIALVAGETQKREKIKAPHKAKKKAKARAKRKATGR